MRRGLVDDLVRVVGPLGVLGVLEVAEHERQDAGLARGELDGQAERPDRVPARRDGVARRAGQRDLRLVEAVVLAGERQAVGVEAGGLGVQGVHGVVVAPLAVLGLVVDGGAVRRVHLHLDLADREVALVVRLVVEGVPERELDVREERDRLRCVRRVGDRDLLDLGVGVVRDEEQALDADAAALAGDPRVAEAVAGLEVVQLRLDRQVGRRPHVAAVVDEQVPATDVRGDVVVAVPRQTAHARVPVEGVAARLVGDQGEELLGTQVVDPRVGGQRRGDDVLACCVVEVPEAHGLGPSRGCPGGLGARRAAVTATLSGHPRRERSHGRAHTSRTTGVLGKRFHRRTSVVARLTPARRPAPTHTDPRRRRWSCTPARPT